MLNGCVEIRVSAIRLDAGRVRRFISIQHSRWCERQMFTRCGALFVSRLTRHLLATCAVEVAS